MMMMKLAAGAAAAVQRSPSVGIPKMETGILALLDRYGAPAADGRGIKIAVLDTGCDLRAGGLERTSDGRPKYIDFIDCTGDGDVDMNKTVTYDDIVDDKSDKDDSNNSSDKTIKGVSGRTLTLGAWADDDNVQEFRTGAVRLYHLLPSSVERRLKAERKKVFVTDHGELISKTQRSLDDARAAPPPKKKNDDKDDKKDNGSDKDEKKKKKREVEELELLLKELQGIADSYDDAGPLMDVVMYENGGVWKVIVDLNADGNLTNAIPISPYAHSGQTGELGFGSAVTFCVQVYEGGNVLSIVTDAGSHGTHVAGIVGANYVVEEENEATTTDAAEGSDDGDKTSGSTINDSKAHLNGVAPGAQILACKIGDGRLGSAETGTGLVRALIASKAHDIDLVNLSYGEPSWRPNSGRVSQTFADAVSKWGLTVFTSAGNDGPALSTLGSPGALTSPITVGAYISPEMMVDQYSTLPLVENTDGTNVDGMVKKAPALEGTSYYFSSRGPTPDGALPDLCAPGGAISPIPRHALQGKAQYHGTSMSSPNACGVAACVLSVLRSHHYGIGKISPHELKRGLVNSAKKVDIVDPFSQGGGLISAVDAVEYIAAHHKKVGQDLVYDVSFPARSGARGLYIRDEVELDGPLTFTVLVKPEFDHAVKRTDGEMDELLNLELDLELRPSASWVTCPERMRLLAATERGGQSFAIRVSKEELAIGANYATIDAYDASDPDRGAIFQVPVTVISPHTRALKSAGPTGNTIEGEGLTSTKDNGVDLKLTYDLTPGSPNRRFITVPPSAEWATIKIRSTSTDPTATSPKRIYVHAVPFVRGDVPNTYIQRKKVIRISEGGADEEMDVRVKGGATLEICLQLLWLANPCPASVVADVEFHSLNARAPTFVSSQPVVIKAATEFARLGANAILRPEKIDPSAELKTVERTIRPVSYKIVAGSTERDVLPPSDAELEAFAASRGEEGGSTPAGTQIYDMNLTYKFKVEGKDAISVTPSIPSLFHQLYDSKLDSQIWVLEEATTQQILGYGSSMHQSSPVSLSKGDYAVKLHLRHPDRNVLEQVKDVPCQISFALPEAFKCEVYSRMDEASTPGVTGDGRSPVTAALLQRGTHQDLYVARPTKELPAWVVPGDTMGGSLVLNKGRSIATTMDLKYNVPPKPVKKNGDDDKSADEEDEESLEDIVFKSKVAYLTKLRTKKKNEEHGKLASTLREEKPDSVPLLEEILKFATSAPKPENTTDEESKWRAEEVGKAKALMMATGGGPIDETVLAQYFGCNPPSEEELKDDKEAKELKKSMDEQRKLLRAALGAYSHALGKLADEDASKVDDFDAAVKDMKKWVGGPANLADDDDKVKLAITLSRHARLCLDKKATAISMLLKARKENQKTGSYKDITNELIGVYKSLDGMDHMIDNAECDIFNRFPVAKQKNLNL